MVPWTTFIPGHLPPPPNPDPEEGPQEILVILANARDLCMLLDNLKPVEEAATRQIVPLMHNHLDVARLAGLDTGMARPIHEKCIVKYAMKEDSSK